jgi:hypothetical protein
VTKLLWSPQSLHDLETVEVATVFRASRLLPEFR